MEWRRLGNKNYFGVLRILAVKENKQHELKKSQNDTPKIDRLAFGYVRIVIISDSVATLL